MNLFLGETVSIVLNFQASAQRNRFQPRDDGDEMMSMNGNAPLDTIKITVYRCHIDKKRGVEFFSGFGAIVWDRMAGEGVSSLDSPFTLYD